MRTPDGTAFDLVGPVDAPVVVLIHGLGLCRQLWRPHIPAFSDTYRILNYDLFGHGDSAAPPQQASLSVYAEQISALMDHVGVSQAALVGFSIGGMINRRFALDYPNRLWALAILNSPHDRGDKGQKAVEDRAKTVRDQGALATMDAALERWFTPEFRAQRPDAMDMVRNWRLQADPEGYAQAAWVLANGVRELICPAPPVATPTLVLTCENDSGSTPDMTTAIAAEIAGSQKMIVPSLQHLGLMEQPEAFTAPVLRLLSEHST